MPEDLPDGVAETAVGAAMMRARESARADGLFVDPYAAAFVAAVPPIFSDGPTSQDDPAMADIEAAFEEVMAVRTRFFDDFVTAAAANGVHQVMLVGAGLDTRAYRLDWPSGVRLFELDLAAVLNFKNRVLAENAAQLRCERITVAVDLQRSDWTTTTLDAGFEPGRPAAWVAEGIVPYLTNDAAERMLLRIGELSSPDSRLALDHAGGADDAVLHQARSTPTMNDIASMWQGGLLEETSPWLSLHGWDAQAVHGESLSAEYGRHESGTTHGLDGVFVTAVRRS